MGSIHRGPWAVLREVLAGERADLPSRFMLAVCFYACAVVARVALDQIIPGRLPYVTYFPALFVTALLCGTLPALSFMAASAATGAFWAAKAQSIATASLPVLFTIVGLSAVLPLAYAHHARRRLEEKDRQLEFINRELNHRLKNLFAVISSICIQTCRFGTSPQDIADKIAGRIQSIVAAQDLLSVAYDEGTDLARLIDAVVSPTCPHHSALSVSGPSVTLPPQHTVAFALVLHELASNAIKHGAWRSDVDDGQVSIEWRLDRRRLQLRWREEARTGTLQLQFWSAEDGSSAHKRGFGTKLIAEGIPGARVEHRVGETGAECVIEVSV